MESIRPFANFGTPHQGWKLQTVHLSGTGKNGAGQVKILDTFRKERLKLWKLIFVYLLRTGKNSAGQADVFDTLPKERLNYFVISTPAPPKKKVPRSSQKCIRDLLNKYLRPWTFFFFLQKLIQFIHS